MWIFLAVFSAFFAGLTAVLSKLGLKSIDSNLATALRTTVVLAFTWLITLLFSDFELLATINSRTLCILIVSGLSTGASWLCYFRALQLGPVNQVAILDKSSILITMLLSILLLHESLVAVQIIGYVLILVGTWLMVRSTNQTTKESAHPKAWLLYGFLSAFFASWTAILGKIGVSQIDSHLATAIRTTVVVLIAWGISFWQGQLTNIRYLSRRNWGYLTLSGLATGISWLCYYRALQLGPLSIIAPIDKLSILVTISFSSIILHERLSQRYRIGLMILVIGTLFLLL